MPQATVRRFSDADVTALAVWKYVTSFSCQLYQAFVWIRCIGFQSVALFSFYFLWEERLGEKFYI